MALECLGTTERPLRKLLSKEFSAQEAQWGILLYAIHQQLHHSGQIHDQIYMQELRNTLNDMLGNRSLDQFMDRELKDCSASSLYGLGVPGHH